MKHFGLMAEIEGGEVATQPESIFESIRDDADLMSRMDSPDFWKNYADNPEVKKAVNSYIFQDEKKKKPPAIKDYSSLGMSANKDMSGFAQAMSPVGLMGAVNSAAPRGLFG